MKTILLILFLFLVTLLQISLMPQASFHSYYPNLFLIIGMVYLLLGKKKLSYIVVIAGGLFLDLISPFRFGLITLSLIIPFILLTLLFAKIIFRPNGIVIFLAFLIIGVINDLITQLLLRLTPGLDLVITGAYTAILGTVLYYFTLRVIRPLESKGGLDVHL